MALFTGLWGVAATPGSAHAVEIRARAGNGVPACVTPDRLMSFLNSRNPALAPRYRAIARLYKQHGEAWRIRWDYAFFQMIVETNALSFRRPDGRPGDVHPRQNNFAGLGATGGGVPGDSYPDVSTGVLAQIQHLVAYSGERLAAPVGSRTQLKQDDIVAVSRALGRPVRFADLARRWAADARYGSTIEAMAQQFREGYCSAAATGAPLPEPKTAGWTATATAPQPAAPTVSPDAARSALGGEPQLVRPPMAATRAAPLRSAVRTVWSRARPGDMPPSVAVALPRAEPRRIAAVAAAAGTAATSTTVAPLSADMAENAARAEPAQAVAAGASNTITAAGPAPTGIAPLPPPALETTALVQVRPMAEVPPAVDRGDGPTIALAAAAAPFAGGTVVAERQSQAGSCRIVMASYGGARAALVRSVAGTTVELVVLSVVPGLEAAAAGSYIRTRAPGGSVAGIFPSRDEALQQARTLCAVAGAG